MRKVNHFILGIQFLTRIPITNKNVPCEPSDFRGAMHFFAIIGLIIGLIQYATFSVIKGMAGPMFAAVVACVAGIWATGGLHLDGLADIFDGFGANQDKDSTLDIMKDSRVGTFGVLALIMDFAIHFVGFYMLQDMPHLYIFVPMSAKVGVCFLCLIGVSIRKGMGSLWIQNITKGQVAWNIAVTCVVGIWMMGVGYSLIGVGLACLTAYLINRYVAKRLGGITGDVLGACSQLVEWVIIFYLLTLLQY